MLVFMCFLQYCVLSPLKWSDLRKSKSMDPDLHHLHRSPAGGGYQSELLSSGLLSCSSSVSSFSDAGANLSSSLSYPFLLDKNTVMIYLSLNNDFQTSCCLRGSTQTPRTRGRAWSHQGGARG